MIGIPLILCPTKLGPHATSAFRGKAAVTWTSPPCRNLTDAVEKGFSVPERRRIFHERLPVENIDSGILHLGFYYCPLWMVHRSLIDFFNSIDPLQKLSRGYRVAWFGKIAGRSFFRQPSLVQGFVYRFGLLKPRAHPLDGQFGV